MTTFTMPVFVFVLSIMIFVSQAAEIGVCQGPCPDSWIYHDGRCYRHIADKKSWLDAELNCLHLGGNLASEHSEEEHEFLKTLHKDHDSTKDPFWIGLSDVHKENVWLWSDGSNPTEFTKWNSGEPNNAGEGEGCVHSNYGDQKNWNDVRCELEYASICALRLSD